MVRVWFAIVVAWALTLAPLMAQDETAKARTDEAVKVLKSDLDRFRLQLQYYGDSDKPVYSLWLQTAPMAVKKWPADILLVQGLPKAQAVKIIDHLAASGFLAKANAAVNQDNTKRALPQGSAYALTVYGAGAHEYYAVLGWDLAMLKQLDALRQVLEGDAAKAMDQLIGRLSGYRQFWEKDAGARAAKE